MFSKQIGKTMEVYVDNILEKNVMVAKHLAHLNDMFSIFRKHQMMHNLVKCAFGVSSRKFLDFMVNQQESEVNPKKIRAIMEMTSHCKVKDV